MKHIYRIQLNLCYRMHFLPLILPRTVFLLYFDCNHLTSLLLVFEQKHKLMDFLETYFSSTFSVDIGYSLSHAQEAIQVEDDFFYCASSFPVGLVTSCVLSETATQVMNSPCLLLDSYHLLGHLLLLKVLLKKPQVFHTMLQVTYSSKSSLNPSWLGLIHSLRRRRILGSQAPAIYQYFWMCFL